jgi:uncharacterized protein (DUF1015 family)
MVDIAPFRALRYAAQEKSTDISATICPPYDVISPAERETIVQHSPHNVIQLELPVAANGGNKYAHASQVLAQWRDEAVLQQDRQPAFYLLETTFRIEDAFAPQSQLKRYGLMAALRLETPGKGAVHPHERTLPKAKEDRLNLLTATRVNVSPIFGLFFDKKNQWRPLVESITKQIPLAWGRERNDLEHKMWKIDDPILQGQLRQLLADKELYIADGHHRYEVAWAYRESRLLSEGSAGLDTGWRRVMAYICPMEEPGLLMLPTHRLIRSEKTFDQWKAHLSSFFEITPAGSVNDVVAALVKKSPKRQIGWCTSKGSFILTMRTDISIDVCLKHPPAVCELDVVLLHEAALGEANGGFLKSKEIIYTRNLDEIQSHLQDPSWVAFILRSPGVESLARVAAANEVMPPKTTYFYPKVPTGFTLMPLEQKIG